MVKNNYLSHWNKQGKDVNDLRADYGIKTALSENIAKESQIIFAHLGLMRSALHRQNILDQHWSRVGLGFAKTTDNDIIVVEIFSSQPLEIEDLPNLREEVLELINNKRDKLLVPSATLTALAQNWSDKMSNEEFFDFQDLQNHSLSQAIRDGGVLQTVGTFIVGNTSWLDARTVILENEEVLNSRWNKLGVGIAQDNNGIIKVTLLYSE